MVANVSPSWQDYTGQTYIEAIGYGWLNAIHPDDRNYTMEQWIDAVKHLKNYNTEFRMKEAGGQWKWTKVVASPIFDSRGKVKKWVCINIDISQRKK